MKAFILKNPNIRIQTRQMIQVQTCGKRKLNPKREVNANFIWINFQQSRQTTNTMVSNYDNTDALSKVEILRKRIQK